MGEKPTVLFVDDEPAIADGHAERVADRYNARTAYDGDAALRALDGVDVVVLDRRMPGRSGDEVLEAIREREADCRVVMATGVEPAEDVIEMGYDAYLVKPIRREELESTVDRLLTEAIHDLDSDVLDAMGDLKARHCWHVLSAGQYSAQELAEVTEYSLTTVYRRLNTLRQAEVVEARDTVDPDGDHYKTFTAVVDEVRVTFDRGLEVELGRREEAASEADREQDAGPEPGPSDGTDVETEAEGGTEAGAEMDTDPEAETDVEAATETDVEAATETEAETDVEAATETDAEPDAEDRPAD